MSRCAQLRGSPPADILAVAWSPVPVSQGGIYHFATAGPKGVLYWTLDPRQGALGVSPLSSASVHRAYQSLAFSPDGGLLHAGTESGDIMTWVLRTGTMTDVTPVVCTKGIPVLTALGDGRLLVGGGDGSLVIVTPGYVAGCGGRGWGVGWGGDHVVIRVLCGDVVRRSGVSRPSSYAEGHVRGCCGPRCGPRRRSSIP